MANINIDSGKIKNSGQRIIDLSNEYNELINDYVSKLEKVNQTIWSGLSANAFVEKVKSNKTAYFEMGKVMKEFGKILVEYSTDSSTKK